MLSHKPHHCVTRARFVSFRYHHVNRQARKHDRVILLVRKLYQTHSWSIIQRFAIVARLHENRSFQRADIVFFLLLLFLVRLFLAVLISNHLSNQISPVLVGKLQLEISPFELFAAAFPADGQRFQRANAGAGDVAQANRENITTTIFRERRRRRRCGE